MNDDLRAAEARHLRRLRKLTNWPLGESGFYARSFELATRPGLPDKDDEHRFQMLIKKLDELYTHSHSVFDEFRPPFDPADANRPKHPENVLRLAQLHFWALVTTTRFEVADLAQTGEIIVAESNPSKPLEMRHFFALAALVFVKEALETLEDSGNLQEAAASCGLAAMWLAHLETESETNRRNKADISAKNKRPGYRVAKDLTHEVIARHFNKNPHLTYQELIAGLAIEFKVGESTVSRRYREAKKKT